MYCNKGKLKTGKNTLSSEIWRTVVQYKFPNISEKSLHTKFSQTTFAVLYLVTALHSGYSSALFSLGVSWQRILAMEILQLPLPAG
jgi:hypothetical protein